MRLFKLTRVTLVGAFLAASLALNVATVAFTSIATLVSAAYEAVTGATAVTSQLRSQVGERDKKIRSLTDEVADLRASREVSYRGRRISVSDAVDDTTARISRRTAAGAARNATATFAEAVPVVGIAVIIGATTWELADACTTMKDLHALDVAFNPDSATPHGVSEVCGLQVPTREELWDKVR